MEMITKELAIGMNEVGTDTVYTITALTGPDEIGSS